jgi:hypothetical protein
MVKHNFFIPVPYTYRCPMMDTDSEESEEDEFDIEAELRDEKHSHR